MFALLHRCEGDRAPGDRGQIEAGRTAAHQNRSAPRHEGREHVEQRGSPFWAEKQPGALAFQAEVDPQR